MEPILFKAFNSSIPPRLFSSFFMGGFECSTHRRSDGQRLDLIASTLHDKYVYEDYQSLSKCGIHTVRDGARWHLIESSPGKYNWSSFLPMVKAARKTNMQVIWDLCHYGWPDNLDIWKPEFVKRFANYAKELAKIIRNETNEIPFYTPINEISFWSWAGADVAYFNPSVKGRGFELKHQLVCATIAAIDAIPEVEPRARFVQAEPLINVINPENNLCHEAEAYTESQYQVYDMLTGKLWPGIGGSPEFLDIIGLNYYPYNQWMLDGFRILRGHPSYKALSEMLFKTYNRYHRPIFIAETGTEGEQRREWINYVCTEVGATVKLGVPIEGICIYPITEYPGWDDNRVCSTGLLGIRNKDNRREVYNPLIDELYIHSNSTFSELKKQ